MNPAKTQFKSLRSKDSLSAFKESLAFLEVKISSLIDKINALWIMINTVDI